MENPYDTPYDKRKSPTANTLRLVKRDAWREGYEAANKKAAKDIILATAQANEGGKDGKS